MSKEIRELEEVVKGLNRQIEALREIELNKSKKPPEKLIDWMRKNKSLENESPIYAKRFLFLKMILALFTKKSLKIIVY